MNCVTESVVNIWNEIVLPKTHKCVICGETFTEVQLIDKKTPNHLKKGEKENCVYKGEVSKVQFPR
ncbi:MAG: hypothetical protein PHS49_03045 [Candidatus Gracilibacteria bacterium]|nr:hypothetical protein [Candidatus Gracilibacteria bacterium]